MSPFTAWVNILIVGLLFGVVAVLDLYGHIAERTALKCYLAIATGVILFIAFTGGWWALILAVPSVAIFAWALATSGEETP